MILVFIFLFLILGFAFSNIGIEVKNFNLDNHLEKLNTKYRIKLKLKLYGIIPFLIITITDYGISFIGIKIGYEKFIENEKFKEKIKNVKNIFSFSKLKILKPDLENINLKLEIGTESVTITSFLVTTVSIALSYAIKNTIKKFDAEKYKYIVKPKYDNKNLIWLEFSGNMNIKTSNFIEYIK